MRAVSCLVSASLLVGGLIGGQGCIGPQSSVMVPSCVDKVEMEGEHRRVGERQLVLDHTFDVPFTRTELTFEQRGPDGKKQREEIAAWNARPSLSHLIVGGGFAGFGLLLGVVAARDVYLGDLSPYDARPFYASLFGLTSLAIAAPIMLTGWHPSEGDLAFQSECAPPPPAEPESYDR